MSSPANRSWNMRELKDCFSSSTTAFNKPRRKLSASCCLSSQQKLTGNESVVEVAHVLDGRSWRYQLAVASVHQLEDLLQEVDGGEGAHGSRLHLGHQVEECGNVCYNLQNRVHEASLPKVLQPLCHAVRHRSKQKLFELAGHDFVRLFDKRR